MYRLSYAYADGTERTVAFPVHMDTAESDVRAVAPATGDGVTLRTVSAGGRELTMWMLLAFLALLLVEWGVSRRVG